MDLDETDKKIITALEKDARVSYTDLSKELKLSDVAVRKRIDRLMKEGIIKKFSVEIDHKKLNRPFHAFLLVKCTPTEANDIRDSIKQAGNIIRLHSILGPYDLLLEVFCKDIEELKALTEENIGNLRGVTEIRTLMVI